MNPEKNSSAALIKPHHLAATVEALRSNLMDLIAYVDEMCARTAQVAPRSATYRRNHRNREKGHP